MSYLHMACKVCSPLSSSSSGYCPSQTSTPEIMVISDSNAFVRKCSKNLFANNLKMPTSQNPTRSQMACCQPFSEDFVPLSPDQYDHAPPEWANRFAYKYDFNSILPSNLDMYFFNAESSPDVNIPKYSSPSYAKFVGTSSKPWKEFDDMNPISINNSNKIWNKFEDFSAKIVEKGNPKPWKEFQDTDFNERFCVEDDDLWLMDSEIDSLEMSWTENFIPQRASTPISFCNSTYVKSSPEKNDSKCKSRPFKRRLNNESAFNLNPATNKKRRSSKKDKPYCSFCRKRGEPKVVYEHHTMKDAKGRTLCPTLRQIECRYCHKDGDEAHVENNCPVFLKQQNPTHNSVKNIEQKMCFLEI